MTQHSFIERQILTRYEPPQSYRPFLKSMSKGASADQIFDHLDTVFCGPNDQSVFFKCSQNYYFNRF